ncbi:MAG: dienelactone hydrolase family protein [bacterium]
MTAPKRRLELPAADGLFIRADVRTPAGVAGPHPVVLVLPGFKGFKDWGMFPPAAEAFAAAGLATITINFSRNGIGDGDETAMDAPERFAINTPGREVRETRAVLDAVTNGAAGSDLDAARIGMLGHSRGGGVAMLVAAADERVKSLVTWAAIERFDRWTERAKTEWRETGRLEIPNRRTGQVLWLEREVLDDLEANRAAYDVLAAATRLRVPYLAIHGEVDEAVGVRAMEQLLGAAGSEDKLALLVPRTGHTFGAVHPWAGPTPAWERVVEESVAWFRRTLA